MRFTDKRHNNSIASLTGKNIVSGMGAFLYFHGIDTSERNNEVRIFYEAPLQNMDIAKI